MYSYILKNKYQNYIFFFINSLDLIQKRKGIFSIFIVVMINNNTTNN